MDFDIPSKPKYGTASIQNEALKESFAFNFILMMWSFRLMTLKPGDIISTGTPPGVGCFRKPPVYLQVIPSSSCLTHDAVIFSISLGLKLRIGLWVNRVITCPTEGHYFQKTCPLFVPRKSEIISWAVTIT